MSLSKVSVLTLCRISRSIFSVPGLHPGHSFGYTLFVETLGARHRSSQGDSVGARGKGRKTL